ncbi:hypothetical protein HK099_004881 [Clydaea vesicula]|uniref:STIL N-terminal domain-containing protein n=1 Tax=Clydaea vesicula TaxID=447962 RepID=A0AAD5XYH1_9FUNG|nr:hypothetical protein HK099_004881 [Clydaea vesicula]
MQPTSNMDHNLSILKPIKRPYNQFFSNKNQGQYYLYKQPNATSVELLWSNKPTGDFIILDPRNYILTKNICILPTVVSYAKNNAGFLIGTADKICLTLDRFDFGKQGANSLKIPTCLMENDVGIQLLHGVFNMEDFKSLIKSNEDSIFDFHFKNENITPNAENNTGSSYNSFLVSSSWPALLKFENFNFTYNQIIPKAVFKLSPIAPIRLVPTLLFNKILEDTSEKKLKTGFVTIDQSRNILPLLGTDIKSQQLPLIGVWIKCEKLDDINVYNICSRFINSKRSKLKLGKNVLLVVFLKHGEKNFLFFECHFENTVKEYHLLQSSLKIQENSKVEFQVNFTNSLAEYNLCKAISEFYDLPLRYYDKHCSSEKKFIEANSFQLESCSNLKKEHKVLSETQNNLKEDKIEVTENTESAYIKDEETVQNLNADQNATVKEEPEIVSINPASSVLQLTEKGLVEQNHQEDLRPQTQAELPSSTPNQNLLAKDNYIDYLTEHLKFYQLLSSHHENFNFFAETFKTLPLQNLMSNIELVKQPKVFIKKPVEVKHCSTQTDLKFFNCVGVQVETKLYREFSTNTDAIKEHVTQEEHIFFDDGISSLNLNEKGFLMEGGNPSEGTMLLQDISEIQTIENKGDSNFKDCKSNRTFSNTKGDSDLINHSDFSFEKEKFMEVSIEENYENLLLEKHSSLLPPVNNVNFKPFYSFQTVESSSNIKNNKAPRSEKYYDKLKKENKGSHTKNILKYNVNTNAKKKDLNLNNNHTEKYYNKSIAESKDGVNLISNFVKDSEQSFIFFNDDKTWDSQKLLDNKVIFTREQKKKKSTHAQKKKRGITQHNKSNVIEEAQCMTSSSSSIDNSNSSIIEPWLSTANLLPNTNNEKKDISDFYMGRTEYNTNATDEDENEVNLLSLVHGNLESLPKIKNSINGSDFEKKQNFNCNEDNIKRRDDDLVIEHNAKIDDDNSEKAFHDFNLTREGYSVFSLEYLKKYGLL